MLRNLRRSWVVGLGIGLLVFSQSGPARLPALGQAPPRSASAAPEGEGNGDNRLPRVFVPTAPGVTLPTDVALTRQLEAAYDYIRQESWTSAVHLLQALLDQREDVLVGVRRAGANGRIVTSIVGVQYEASRLLAHLPPRGQEFYETTYGPPARALLVEANRTGDVILLAEVARRYFHTTAGAEATRLLGLYYLDRGRSCQAALCFARLLDRAGGDRLSPSTLFAATLAFRLAGQQRRAEQTWERLLARAPSGLRRGGQLLGLPELEKELHKLQTAAASPLAQDAGPAPLLETRWTQTTASETVLRNWVQPAVQKEEERSQMVLPPSVPLLVGDRIFLRSYSGVQAVDRQSGKLLWESASEWGLDRMTRELRYQPYLSAWISGYSVNNPHVVIANATLGTLSTDGTRVYAVEDLPLPPFPLSNTNSNIGRGRRGPFAEPDFGPDLTRPANHSHLLALDAQTGKLLWESGVRSSEFGVKGSNAERRTPNSELNDCYFLGSPLPLEDGLYGVIEKNQELRLVCLDAATGQLRWAQSLAVPADKLLRDVARRMQPLAIRYEDGVLICPTNAGVVLGVDLFHRHLAWAHAYRDENVPPDGEPLYWGRRGRYYPRELPRLREDWKAAVPVIHANQVLLTAPDAPAIECLDLHSGTLRWKADRKEDDLYLAGVVGNKILIVGKSSCRALGLTDGRPAWSVATGVPSGRGVAAGDVYYLPLKAALPEKQPAVLALDVRRGTILTRAAVPKGEVPGNLVLGGDDLLSQTVTALTTYLRLKDDEDREK